jgi:hypothetical protein
MYDNNGNPDGAADGTSWGRAVTDLQWLMDNKFDGTAYTEIWIEGTVYPESWAAAIPAGVRGDARNRAFVLIKPKVKLYGGFGGTEYGTGAAEGRNKREKDGGGNFTYGSVLSGETPEGKAYHVVIAAGISGEPPELRDLSIRSGYASSSGSITVNGRTIEGAFGGGLYSDEASPRLENLEIRDNRAGNRGGGLYAAGSAVPGMARVRFLENTASSGGGLYYGGPGAAAWGDLSLTENLANDGGGLYAAGGTLILEGASFTGNDANYMGGGAYIDSAALFISNHGEWRENTAYEAGGGAYGGAYHLNSLFTANTAVGRGGALGSEDPLTVVNSTLVKNGAAVKVLVTYTGYDRSSIQGGGGIAKASVAGKPGALRIYNSLIWGNTNTLARWAPTQWSFMTNRIDGPNIHFYTNASTASVTAADYTMFVRNSLIQDAGAGTYSGTPSATGYTGTAAYSQNLLFEGLSVNVLCPGGAINGITRSIGYDLVFDAGRYGPAVETGQEDSIFAGYGSGNYRLKSGSPAIGGGNGTDTHYPLSLAAFETKYGLSLGLAAEDRTFLDSRWNKDLAGNNRVNNGTIDIGAYEY